MSVYGFEAQKPNGQAVSLSEYRNKVLLIVNTASKCKFTPQFDDLQKLYNQFKDSPFEILGFPCNQFGEQEPGTSEEAEAFCKINYGVTFPIFAKVDVNGEHAHPLFKYLVTQLPFRGFDETNFQEKLLKMMIFDKNPIWLTGDQIKWNFTKFLIDADGQPVKRYEPTDEFSVIAEDIRKLLSATAVRP